MNSVLPLALPEQAAQQPLHWVQERELYELQVVSQHSLPVQLYHALICCVLPLALPEQATQRPLLWVQERELYELQVGPLLTNCTVCETVQCCTLLCCLMSKPGPARAGCTAASNCVQDCELQVGPLACMACLTVVCIDVLHAAPGPAKLGCPTLHALSPGLRAC